MSQSAGGWLTPSHRSEAQHVSNQRGVGSHPLWLFVVKHGRWCLPLVRRRKRSGLLPDRG